MGLFCSFVRLLFCGAILDHPPNSPVLTYFHKFKNKSLEVILFSEINTFNRQFTIILIVMKIYFLSTKTESLENGKWMEEVLRNWWGLEKYWDIRLFKIRNQWRYFSPSFRYFRDFDTEMNSLLSCLFLGKVYYFSNFPPTLTIFLILTSWVTVFLGPQYWHEKEKKTFYFWKIKL